MEIVDQEYCSVVSGVEQGQMQVVVVQTEDVNYAEIVQLKILCKNAARTNI